MKILAFDSSSRVRSVVVGDGSTGDSGCFDVLSSAEAQSSRGAPFASLIDHVLAEGGVEVSEIEAIAVGVGPGSAAGIRSTIAFAEGWHLARGVNVSAVSSCRTLAEQALMEGLTGAVLVAIPGPGAKIYSQGFELSARRITEGGSLRLVSAVDLAEDVAGVDHLVGPELDRIKDRLNAGGGAGDLTTWIPLVPSAHAVARVYVQSCSGEKLPLEPLTLARTEFVKAPPPREIPDV